MRSIHVSAFLSSSLLALLAACGGAEPPPVAARATEQPSPEIRGDGQSDHDACTAVFLRQRECTDVYIPALVDLRLRLDVPPGIAAAAASDGRDALVTQALAEWADDSTDAAIDATCTRIIADLGPAQTGQLREQTSACVAAASCAAFVDCFLPVMEARLAAHE